MIHPTAIIHPKAEVDASVQVGPYAVIDQDVQIGPHCLVGPYVYLTGKTIIGTHNKFHAGCVVGDAPQDLKYQGAASGLRIGDQNIFREHCTVHRANHLGEETVLGSRNLLMASCHVGHNASLGNHIILANGALLAGHVLIEDQALISGNCLVHQFVRIGMLALMQGGSAISKDLPPFCVARGDNGMCGLNTVGLRRADFTSEERLELKKLYRTLFRSRLPLKDALKSANSQFQSDRARHLIAFVSQSTRGLVTDTTSHD